MKIRIGFVSNSSSSSFIIAKAYMTEEQIESTQEFIENFKGEAWVAEQDNYFAFVDGEFRGEEFIEFVHNLDLPRNHIYEGD